MLVEYNRQATEMMIERIKLKDLDDMLETLANSSVISRVLKQRKRFVRLEVELEELSEALAL